MKSSLPAASLLAGVPHNYLDSYAVTLNSNSIAIETIGKAFFSASPVWVDKLLELRNRMVSFIGLKVPGAGTKEEVLRNFKCEVGESVALFHVLARTENEVILGEDDKHLDFRVSLFLDRQNCLLTVSTLVKIHNNLGRLYMFVIKPFHKIIVPAIAKGISNEVNKA